MYVVSAMIAMGIAWPWLSLRGIDGELSFEQPRGCEQRPSRIRIKIRNRLPWPVWGLFVCDGFTPATAGDNETEGEDQELVGLATIAAWSRSDFHWEFVPRQRGEYPLRPPALATSFPFGLWRARCPLSTRGTLLVWPRAFPLDALAPPPRQPCFGGHVELNKPGKHGEFLGVRAYQRGDSLRRVHWAKTAMHDRLMVREQQALAHRRVQIVLDANQNSYASGAPHDSLEWAIRAVASAIDSLLGEGTQLEAMLGGQRFAAGASKRTLFDALARLHPAQGLSLSQLVDAPAVRLFQGDLQVIVTTREALAGVLLRNPTGLRRLVVSEPSEFVGARVRSRPDAELPQDFVLSGANGKSAAETSAQTRSDDDAA